MSEHTNSSCTPGSKEVFSKPTSQHAGQAYRFWLHPHYFHCALTQIFINSAKTHLGSGMVLYFIFPLASMSWVLTLTLVDSIQERLVKILTTSLWLPSYTDTYLLKLTLVVKLGVLFCLPVGCPYLLLLAWSQTIGAFIGLSHRLATCACN